MKRNDLDSIAEAPEVLGAPVSLGQMLAQRLLDIPASVAGVRHPGLFLQRATEALADLLQTRVELFWADAGPVEPPTEPSLDLPVYQHGDLLATIRAYQCEHPLVEVGYTLKHLAGDLGLHVNALTTRLVRKTVSELRTAMTTDLGMEAVAQGAAEVITTNLGAEAALVILRRTDELTTLASVGDWAAEPGADAYVMNVAREGIDAPGALRHCEAFVSVPIATTRPARCVLVLRFTQTKQNHGVLFPLLDEVASVMAPVLNASWRDRVLTELLELNRASEDTESSEMYDRVLRTALQLVPGADSGSLITRTDPTAPFTFQAAVGFDLAGLRKHSLTEEAVRAWYGVDGDGWSLGVPRILTAPESNISDIGTTATPDIDPDATRYSQIQATLCLPVLRDGKVMAVLDLDNQRSSEYFGEDSLKLAHLFGAPLASLLHRQRTRELLHKAAMTDDLTGLANRRAFNEALEREVARARRGGHGPSVLHMDLKGFKAINDSFGHDQGDTVLKMVANAIRANIRTIDVVARYGGDEFMGVLIDTPYAEAARVADRIQEAVAAIDVGLGPVRIDIGVTSYDVDGGHTDDVSRLMKLSDARMYRAKRAAE